MKVVDSSGWLEYFADGPAAGFFAPAIEDAPDMIVPAISIFEVFKRLLQQRGENAALSAVAIMQQSEVVELSPTLALSAATLSVKHKLPMADSIMYATARAFDATLWTQDADFAELPHVRFHAARARR